MPSRSRARRSSRSSLKNSFKSASILEQGGQPALRDKVPSTSNTGAQDEIEPATFTSQPEFPRLSRPLGPQSPSAGAVMSAAINTVAGTAVEFAQSEASTLKPDFIHEHSGQHPSQDEDIMPSTTTEDEIVAVPRTPQPGSTHLPHPFLPGSWASGGAASAHTATAGPAADNPAESPTRGESAGIRIHPMASGQRDPLPHTQFGLPTDQFRGQYPQGGPRMDYKQKYPEDPTYKETEENARVFHVYNDESQIFDNGMILEAGDSLDILLVFAGLFASVLTTFVAQTSQSLSPDKTEISNSLLREMISLQRAQENGTSFTSIPTADTSFVASRSDIWVNSLWFVSLALSLSTALLAVIAKQWLRQYSSFISGTPREHALIHQFRYDGLEKWGVRLIIGLLPTILHVSLFLFMGGLVVFLLPLNNTLARVVASVTGFICAAYAIMNILPVIFPQCPYRTPLSEILNSIYGFVVFIPVFLRALLVMVPCILVIFPWILVASLLEHVRVVDDGNDWIPDWLEALVLKPEWITFTVSWPDPLREVERQRANKADSWGRPLGISGTLMWLAQNTSDISAKACC